MTLTVKQQKQVNKAPQARRAALRAMYNRQNSSQQQKTKPPAQPTRAQRAPARKMPAPGPRGNSWAFDAFDQRHMPVDELTAPYTTTNLVNHVEFHSKDDMDKIIVVAPRTYYRQETNQGPLTDVIAVVYDASEALSGSISTLQRIRSHVLDEPAPASTPQWTSVRGRLHNLSVRLSCLGTSTGIMPTGSCYIGTVPSIETGVFGSGAADGLTLKQAWAEDSIAVGYIRPFPASRLMDKPVTLHAAVAENVSYKQWRDFVVAEESQMNNVGAMPISTAMEPILIYLPAVGNADVRVNYRLEIGQQWCTRHPHNVMLRATQKQHPATPPAVWQSTLAQIKDVGQHMLQTAGGAVASGLADKLIAAGRQVIVAG